ncbi:hypothetical protein AAG570_014096 [Ranatra chinensis]|uniref:Uncharacterized protein n=1 Tax=Ranatra chinensis TaxID=642074 RepID=A0ABD0YAM5_9HEMI
MVGGQQWLFNLQLDPEKAAAFCVRSDVDGCVWQPGKPPSGNDTSDWPCPHVGTFLAFGYVQASKMQKKFTLAPPDMSYVAIADTTGHVIVYRRGVQVAGALRNRKTGRQVSQVASQQLVNLHTGQGVALLGGFATDRYIFLLTSEKIYCLHVTK